MMIRAPRKISYYTYLSQVRQHNEKSDSRHKSGPSRERTIELVRLVNIHRSLLHRTNCRAESGKERTRFLAITAKKTFANYIMFGFEEYIKIPD